MNLIMDKSMKSQEIFNSYKNFLESIDMSDRIVMIITYDFDEKDSVLNDLIIKLKSSNARIHNFKIKGGDQSNQSIKGIFNIVDFMEKYEIDTLIGIGEDFLSDLIKAITVFYNNRNIDSLHKLEENKMFLKYGRLKESIFIPTTGGGSESHRYFKLIDSDSSQVTIFGDQMCKIDKIVLDAKIATASSLDYTMYYMFSVIANLVDIILNDRVDKEHKEFASNILRDAETILENGEKFGDSLLFRETVLKCSISVSKLIDEFGYGILYFYGNLIESVFSIPRHTIDALGIEFFINEIRKRYSIMHLYSYINIDLNLFLKYKNNYGAMNNLNEYKVDLDMFDKVKNLALNFIYQNKIIDKYAYLNFNAKMNEELFEHYLNGVNL
ncbi:iron-containing alcohol dehydrogenase [Candidatus Arthromitus sp. SFB-rat-Yit]|uniref:iron-containing alcohol dehydrogenase n=1 Tax=Candidatus Arthromitus sp. SFB-rat-Yit TaxID=1041504 RepID=UPI000227A4F5|nr:iron-containing alcohol dehydrogenase [Candidatus Arthromitus sp. SFB-rat-Yit]BAK81574.1 putative iron-containing alcohol dehydrogenase [Candidatus Arthromitus sp. SFB-rat-Yit]